MTPHLLSNQHRFRLLIESVRDYAIFLTDLEGRVSSWNEGAQRILGFAEREILGQPADLIFTPEDRNRNVPQLEMATARREGRAVDERWHVRSDGSRFFASGVLTAVYDGHANAGEGDGAPLVAYAKVMCDITERKLAEQSLAAQHAVSQVLAESPGVAGTMSRVLAALCKTSDWQWAALWNVDEREGVLRCGEICRSVAPELDAEGLAELEALSRSTTFAPGVGLPGRVWSAASPAWVADVAEDENFPRRRAAVRAGLRGAVAFPVTWGAKTLAVMEFLSRDVRPPEAPLLSLMAAIGAQVGQSIDRQRAGEAMREIEARHRASIEAALDCIVSMDHQGLVVEWNPAAERTFGFSRAEALGREMAELIIPPALRSRHRAGLARYLETGEGPVIGSRIEITALRRDGTEFPVELAITRLPSQGPPAFTGYLRDLTDRKRADEARRMSEFRSQRLIEQSPLSTQVFAPDGTVRQVNPAWERLWGLTLDEFPGYNILEDEQLGHHGMLALIRRAFAGEAVTIEPIPYTPDRGQCAGQVRWCGAYVYPVKDDAGRVEEVVLVHNDVTEQRRVEAAVAESEMRFRQLAETIPQLAWMARPDGWIFWYNRRWYQYTGATPEQMEGWGWQSVHDPAHLPRVIEGWQRSITTGEPFEMEFPIKAADGQFRWFLTRVAPLRDSAGNLELWFGTNTDIEDRRRVTEERARLLDAERAARADAERASRMKDEFLATLSHELRTPLNAILGWSQILRHGGGIEALDLAEGLETIERNARAQAKIVEDLLDMSRIISGKVRLDVQRVDLAAVVAAAADTVRHAADAKGVRLHVVLDPIAGPVSGDANRLQQIFWNLLSNAIKFTPRGGRVQVLLERVNSHLEISVIDNGEGIRPEFLPHVFDRFKQADASTTRHHGGLGLGLSIVKQLVELHGGTVRAKSPGEGMGATFIVALPLTPIHAEAAPRHERRHPDVEPHLGPGMPDDCPKLKGVRVLVVDDEADSRALVKRLLRDCEASVITAASAAEGLEAVKRDRPHVLISDIGMPVADGYTLIREIRALDPAEGGGTPAIALTAYARSEDRRRAIMAGYNYHVAKPVEPAELITIVASLVGRTSGS